MQFKVSDPNLSQTLRKACRESQSPHMKDFMRLVSADTAQRGEILQKIYYSSSVVAGSPVNPPIEHMKEMRLLSQQTFATTPSQIRAKEEMNLLLTNAIEAFELISAVRSAIFSFNKEEDEYFLPLLKKLRKNLKPSEDKGELTKADL